MVPSLLMGVAVWALAVIGAYHVAGLVGLVVIGVFFITSLATAVQRARSPKGRAMRHISHILNELEEEALYIRIGEMEAEAEEDEE